ncbi:MAG TPA: flagellar FlbD family protein [Acidobacteriaceae bacterium]|nr:flagellar FlbD family protein [Acidobacteriaceae bacterium]
MIPLTRLNGNSLVVNSDLIKCAESSPDTMLTLINGEKIVVLESCDEVVRRTIAWRGSVLAEAATHLQAVPWTSTAILPGAENSEASATASSPDTRRANSEA